MGRRSTLERSFISDHWMKVAEKKAELDRRRPLNSEALASLDAWYDVELIYSSNSLEGNTLTRSETAIVLDKGITVRGKPLKDHLEAIDHRDALIYVRNLAISEDVLRQIDIREIHRLVLARSDPSEAGRYSQRHRSVVGSIVEFPSPAEIDPLMQEFVDWLGGEPVSPAIAIEAHARLVSIHPFSDGNGRTARLLMTLILLRSGYPPIVIRPEDRPDYIDSLEKRQIEGDNTPFENLMLRRLEASLDAYLKAVGVISG